MHKIAVIEDADDNRDLMYYLLRDEFEVSRHSSGEDALRSFADDVPDLVILDIRLQGMDGIEVLRHIRQNTRLHKILVLALTASVMSGDREKYLAAGFNEYASKPIVDTTAFISTLRRMLSDRQ
jgi:two-component system, cell cycle response regulator DivK